jgi:hypothetical protein
MRFFCPPGHISQQTKTFTPNTKGGRRIAMTVAVAVAAAEIVRVPLFAATGRVDKGKEATNEALVRHKEIVRVEGRPGAVVRRRGEASAGLIVIASPVPNRSRCQRWTRKFAPMMPRWKY